MKNSPGVIFWVVLVIFATVALVYLVEVVWTHLDKKHTRKCVDCANLEYRKSLRRAYDKRKRIDQRRDDTTIFDAVEEARSDFC